MFALVLLASCLATASARGDGKMRRAVANSHVGARLRVPQPGTLDVTDFGAKPNNATDNTAPFQAALDACTKQGGGEVFVPTGHFVFKGGLTIPPGCTLSGTYTVVPSHDMRQDNKLNDGTVLIPTAGRNLPGGCDINCTEAFIHISSNGNLRGLVIYYQEQETVQTPVPYPWAVFMQGNNAALTDVELLGAWNGVAAVAAHRHYIARVQGQPLNIGVFVDETYDIGRLEDVHFNPWYSSATPFIWYQTTHGRAFVLGRSDWEYVFNTFAFGYAIGYHFIERATGSMNGNFLGIGQDLAVNASVQVDQSQPYGILITNGEFTSFCAPPFCPPHTTAPTSQVVVSAKNVGAVKFVNSAFWGRTTQIAQVNGFGTVTFSQCHFDQWDNHLYGNGTKYQAGTAAIQQGGGTMIVSQSEFTCTTCGKTPHHFLLGPEAKKTIISENIVRGPLSVENQGKGKVIVVNNADDAPVSDEL